MKRLNSLCLVFLFLFFAACSTTSTKAPPKVNTSKDQPTTFEYFNIGSQAFDRWMDQQEKDPNDLKIALVFLAKAHNEQPDNVVYQASYYNAKATIAFFDENYNEQELLASYKKLHPEAMPNAITPAFVSFKQSQYLNQSLKEQIQHMLRAVEQNPNNPQNWHILSMLYYQQQQYWLAFNASKQSIEIIPESVDYNAQAAMILNDQLADNNCPIDDTQRLKLAIPYANKAANLEKKLSYLPARLYALLGVKPLFYKFAYEAYLEEHTAENIDLVVKAAIVNNNPSSFERVVNSIESNPNNAHSRSLALWEASQNNWDKALLAYVQYLKNSSKDFDIFTIVNWIAEILEADQSLLPKKASSDWHNAILDYLNNFDQHPSDHLQKLANNRCQLIDANFYTAYANWKKGDTGKAIHYLDKVLNERVQFTNTQMIARYLKNKLDTKAVSKN